MASELIELTLEAFAYGGEALGRDGDGRVVFVPFASPGERVQVEILERRKRWARGRLVQLLEAAPERVAPRCSHYGVCGGCHYQHLPYADQLAIKAELLREQLQRLGGCPDPPVEPTVPSPSPWNARNQLQFSLDSEGRLGFIRADSGATKGAGDGSRVLPIQECHLPEEPLAEFWPLLELHSIAGLDRVTVRAGREGQILMLLHASGPPEVELSTDHPASVLWAWPEGMTVLAGSPSLSIEVRGRPFRVTGSSFFQVHTALATVLVELVLQGLQPAPDQVIFDLFAGVGLFSAFLAQSGCQVVAVERDPQACEDFSFNLAGAGVELHQTSVEIGLAGLQLQPAGVVVDPPRAGLSSQVTGQILAAAPDRLVYVSCDPATLGRDAKLLIAGGYRLERVTPLDLFPQTFHIESVSLFVR